MTETRAEAIVLGFAAAFVVSVVVSTRRRRRGEAADLLHLITTLRRETLSELDAVKEDVETMFADLYGKHAD